MRVHARPPNPKSLDPKPHLLPGYTGGHLRVKVVRERDSAVRERDRGVGEQNRAVRERDRAVRAQKE